MGISLYHITEEYRQALQELSDADLPDDVLRDTLEALSGELIKKGEAVAAFALNLGAEIDAIKAELSETDYQVIKCFEASLVGEELPYEIKALHTERDLKRAKINTLETNLLNLTSL